MQNRRPLFLLALLAGLGAAACGSEDVPLGEPSGMGAERPDTTGPAESGVIGEEEPDAQEVLEGMGMGPTANTPDTAGTAPDTSR